MYRVMSACEPWSWVASSQHDYVSLDDAVAAARASITFWATNTGATQKYFIFAFDPVKKHTKLVYVITHEAD